MTSFKITNKTEILLTYSTDYSNNLNIAIQRIDKAMTSGLVHKNKAARLKSRLIKMMNTME